MDESTLHRRRREAWGQTPRTRAADPEAAARLIDRVGIATLFPASPEFPNLFHAYVGESESRPDARHDSPSGEVYAWRWALGRKEVACYTAIVRDRPSWVSWSLLPAVLRLRGTLRPPTELHDTGELSASAARVALALERSGGVLSTSELREAADFPTGKAQRAAYLKAVQELETKLLLAKVFSADSLEMRHALVSSHYPEHLAAASGMSEEEALDRVLRTYLAAAAYAVPAVLSRHLKLPPQQLVAALDRLIRSGMVTPMELPGLRGTCYVWRSKDSMERH